MRAPGAHGDAAAGQVAGPEPEGEDLAYRGPREELRAHGPGASPGERDAAQSCGDRAPVPPGLTGGSLGPPELRERDHSPGTGGQRGAAVLNRRRGDGGAEHGIPRRAQVERPDDRGPDRDRRRQNSEQRDAEAPANAAKEKEDACSQSQCTSSGRVAAKIVAGRAKADQSPPSLRSSSKCFLPRVCGCTVNEATPRPCAGGWWQRPASASQSSSWT